MGVGGGHSCCWAGPAPASFDHFAVASDRRGTDHHRPAPPLSTPPSLAHTPPHSNRLHQPTSPSLPSSFKERQTSERAEEEGKRTNCSVRFVGS